MYKNPINYIKYGLLILPVFFGAIDFYNSFTTDYSISFTKYMGLTGSQAFRWMLVCLFFSLVAFLTSALFSIKWRRFPTRSKRISSKSAKRINLYLKAIFLAIASYKILSILYIGILNYLLFARSGEIEIGGLLYFVLLMFPFVLAYDVNKNGLSWSNILSILVLFFLNLVTGFRLLLIYGLAVIIIFNYKSLIMIKKSTWIMALFVFALLLIGYERSRQELESSGLNLEIQGAMDSLNRSRPLNSLQLISDKEVSLPLTDVSKLVTVPIATFLKTFGVENDDFFSTRFNLNSVSEPLFRDYLVWRGTPLYEATGFSVSIVSYSYLFYRELGVIFFAFFYGFFIAIGCKLLNSNFYEGKIFGSTLLVASLFCNEAIVEASTLLVFALIFLAFMWVLATFRQTIIRAQRSTSKNL